MLEFLVLVPGMLLSFSNRLLFKSGGGGGSDAWAPSTTSFLFDLLLHLKGGAICPPKCQAFSELHKSFYNSGDCTIKNCILFHN
jgi:hypothetical protein